MTAARHFSADVTAFRNVFITTPQKYAQVCSACVFMTTRGALYRFVVMAMVKIEPGPLDNSRRRTSPVDQRSDLAAGTQVSGPGSITFDAICDSSGTYISF